MNFRHKKFILYSAGIFVLLMAVTILANQFCNAWDLYILVAFGAAILFLTILIVFRTLLDYSRKSKSDTIAITDGWSNFYDYYPLKLQLPLLTTFTIAPDFAFQLAEIITSRKPKLIMELGSGRSTLIAAALFRMHNISGKIISIDADVDYLSQCSEFAKRNQLEPWITFIHAQLATINLNGKNHLWYDTAAIPKEKFELLVIDGPPEVSGDLSRYPALHVLMEYADANAIILVDDATRSDMQLTTALWKNAFPGWHFKYAPTLHGTLIIESASH